MTTFIGYELTEVHIYHLSFSAAAPSVWGLKNMGKPCKNLPGRGLNRPAPHTAV